MDNSIYIANYEFAQYRMNDLFNWLKNYFNCKIKYIVSYANYFKMSDYGLAIIYLDDVNSISNSITLETYMCDTDYEYFISFWYYTGGEDFGGHHSFKFNISKFKVSDDNYFFNFVKNKIRSIFNFKDNNVSNVQMSIFDFI